jgi:predicted alpha/beta superfamily hydrolase
MRRKFLLSSVLLLVVVSAVYAQPQRVVSAAYYQHIIKSQAVGEDRTILVRVPNNYENTDTRYPVVYMLDGHPPHNAMMAGLVEQQGWSGTIPDLIVVGIQNTNRTRDMTPTAGDRPGAGGAKNFLRFIETEVIPLVDKTYRTAPYRTLAGHSLGGLFTMYAFTESPDVFDAYIAASPHLQWDKSSILKRLEDAVRKRPEKKKTMFFGLGNEPDYLESFRGLENILKNARSEKIEYEFNQFKDENHGSVVLPAYFGGLRKVYAGWEVPRNSTIADLENHYQNLSSRFGYPIKPPEAMVNLAGYQFLRAGNIDEAILVFKRNVANHPRSANVYDSLAEAYEAKGDDSKARELYEKAWRMAEQSGETQLAASARANYERIAAKKK